MKPTSVALRGICTRADEPRSFTVALAALERQPFSDCWNGHGGGKSKVRAHVIPEQWMKPVNEIIKNTVEKGTHICSDEHWAYYALGSEGFNHAFVRHAEYYVDGAVHTHGIENFWSFLKRAIKRRTVSY